MYPLGSMFLSHRKVKESYTLAIAGFTVKAVCLLIFVPFYGIWGAVIGILANTAVTLIISMYIIYKSGEFNNV
jgi:O-antigen/teichoic acid export membrane protein